MATKESNNTDYQVSEIHSIGDMPDHTNPRDVKHRFDDIEGQEVVVYAADPRNTNFGLSYNITIGQIGSSETFEIMSNAKHVKQELQKALDNNFFPFRCRFIKRGNGWYVDV